MDEKISIPLKKIYTLFDTLREIVIVMAFIFIIVMCFAEVVARHLPWIRGFGGTEEILRYLDVWIVMLGASIAAKRSAHFKVEFFVQRWFGGRARKAITVFVNISVLLFLAVIIYFGSLKTIQNFQQNIRALPVPFAFFYMAIPIGCVYMFVDILLILIVGHHPLLKLKKE
jgi:TRAP-type C4-dicarboxylate transport system permease small subunit